MQYLNLFQGTAFATASDGRKIPCNYLEHPRFSHECNFCSAIHYVFVRFCPDRSYSKGYELRKTINVLLDFAVQFERANPKPLWLDGIEKLSAEAFYGFHHYVQKTNAPKGIAARLGSALTAIARSHEEGMPLIPVPIFGYDPGKPYEPLTADCFNQLTQALKFHIDFLYKKLEFRVVVQQAIPYSCHQLSELDKNPLPEWAPDDAKSLKTLIAEGHPFIVKHEEFIAAIRSAKDRAAVPGKTGASEFIYRRYLTTREGKFGGNTAQSLDELFARYYPTAMDQVALAVFISLQTGWNKELVMSIDGKNFLHALTGALNDNNVLVFSEKNKSQGKNKPFKDPKMFLFPSSKVDKYSVYNLICLAKNLSDPLAGLRGDHVGSEHETLNPLFACIRNFKNMFIRTHMLYGQDRRPGRYFSVSAKSAWTTGIEAFFDIYVVFENGKRLTAASDIGQRLRPNWVQFVRNKRKSPLSVIALQQGHQSIETTDVHYDSSGPAIYRRRQRLREQLDNLLQLLRKKKFKGLISKRDDKSIDITSMRIFTLPGHNRSLWACRDSYKPDWLDCSAQVPAGNKCSSISKCLFCSQVCVFEDSLPFLMERQSYLQSALENSGLDAPNFPNFEELGIIEYIFDVWGDDQALKEAARYYRKHPGLLPPDISTLSILFEDEA